MLKSVGAVAWGLFTFASVFIMAVLAAYIVLGTDRAAPGGQISPVWGAMACAAALLAGFFGGVTSRIPARGMAPALVVIAIVVVALAAVLGGRVPAPPGTPEAALAAAPETDPAPVGPRAPVEDFGPVWSAAAPLWLVVICPLMAAIGLYGGARLFHGLKARDSARTMP